MPDEVEVPENELEGADAIKAARAAFLSDAPPILSSDEPEAPAAPAGDEFEDVAPESAPAAPEGAAPSPAEPPAAGADPYAEFGGREQVVIAHDIQEALKTEQGLRFLAAQSLVALGYDPEQVRVALAAEATGEYEEEQPQAAPWDGIEDEELVSGAQLKQIIAAATQQAAAAAVAEAEARLQPVQEAVQTQAERIVTDATNAAILEVLGQPPAEAEFYAPGGYKEQMDRLVAEANKNFDGNPLNARGALLRAKAQIEADDEAIFQRRLAAKRADKAKQPPNIGGGAGTEGPAPEPKNLKEARKMAEEAGLFR